jgi:succinoglycan biosynthesis transport protein ExoP
VVEEPARPDRWPASVDARGESTRVAPLRRERADLHAAGPLGPLLALRWRWKPALVVAALFAAGSAWYVNSLPSEYDGEAIVAIGPRADAQQVSGDTVRVLAPKYVEYVVAPATIDEVAPRIGERADDLESAVDATLAADTGTLKISVRMSSPERAATAANALANRVVEFSRTDPLLTVQLVARALPAIEPAAPARGLLTAAGAFAGIVLSAAFFLLLERGTPRIRSWREIPPAVGYPVIGRLPSSRVVRKRPLEAFSDSIVGASFRSLRAGLEPQFRDSNMNAVLVTSVSSGEGKTTVATLFAESLARIGMKVLLVDGDLKRPGISRITKLRGSPGLATVLRDGTSWQDAVSPGWGPNLSVLPTTSDPEGGDLLATRFEGLLGQMRREFELVVIDGAPLIGADDARTVAPMADGVLLVVRAGTKVADLNEAILVLEALNAPLLGVVANRFEHRAVGYY